MFAAYLCLRPAAGRWSRRSGSGCGAVLRAILSLGLGLGVLLVATGYWMLVTHFGGFAGAPPYIHIMQALGWLMILLFACCSTGRG